MNSFVYVLAVFVVYQSFVRGQSSCTTPNGITGTCKPIRDCRVLLALLLDITNNENRNSADEDFLNRSQCGFRDIKPKVCCPPEAIVNPDCFTPDGNSGQCVDIRQCNHLLQMLKPPISQQAIEYVKQSRCMGQAERSVCCGPETGSGPTKQVLQSCVSAYAPHSSTGCCGIERVDADDIVGINVTRVGQYPWVALIEYYKGDNVKTLCAGALISSNYVITTAHCVKGEILTLGTPRNVRLGEYDVTVDGPDCVDMDGFVNCADEVLRIPIDTIIPHPEHGITRRKINDIALIRLRSLAPYTDFIRPICLPQMDVTLDSPSNLYFYQAGWGIVNTQSFKSNNSVKVHLRVPFVNNEQCEKGYSKYKLSIHKSQICAGGAGHTLCKGSSGSPLMHKNRGIFEIVGLTSFGPRPCGTNYIPDVYTKVYEYRDWLIGLIKP